MPQEAELAGVTWEALAPASRVVRRLGAGGALRRARQGQGLAAGRLCRSRHGTAAATRAGAAGCRRASSRASCARPSSPSSPASASSSPISTSPTSSASMRRRWRSPGLPPSPCSRAWGSTTSAALSAAHRQLPRVLHGLDCDRGAAARGRLLSQGRAGLLPRLAGPVVRERRRRTGRLPRRRRGPDAARPGRGAPDATRHRLRHRTGLREPAAGARRRSRQRHPHLRRVRRPRHRAGEPDDCRPCQPRQPRRADGLLPAHARRHADRGAAGLGRDARAPAHQEAVGAARRHPPRGAGLQAPLPPAHLLLRRHRAADRHHRPADHRLGRRRSSGCSTRAWPPWRCWASPR